MSAVTELASAAVSGIWKVVAIALLVVAAGLGVGLGFGWWLAAHDRDVARADLAVERTVGDGLRDAIREQNRGLEALAKSTKEAEARGATARALAAANGKRYEQASAALVGARATTCADAMPAVNKLLESVR